MVCPGSGQVRATRPVLIGIRDGPRYLEFRSQRDRHPKEVAEPPWRKPSQKPRAGLDLHIGAKVLFWMERASLPQHGDLFEEVEQKLDSRA